MTRRQTLLALAACATLGALALAPTPARASEFPERPVRLIVPFGPGGATDVAARILAESMTRSLGQSVIVENRPGGNGVIAIQAVGSSKPDGYTLLVGNVTTNVINPLLKGSNVRNDFALVGRLVEVPAILVATRKDFPPTTVAELVSHAKANPGKLFYNTSGVLSYSHLDMLELQRRAGIQLQMVPVSAGGGSAQTDILSGEVQLALRNAASVHNFVKGGQLKALAVTTDTRLPAFPDVPTMREQGYPGVGTNAWQAIFAPAQTPRPVLARLHAAIQAAVRDPAAIKRLDDLQIMVRPNADLDEARTWLDSEYARWKPITDHARQLPEARQ